MVAENTPKGLAHTSIYRQAPTCLICSPNTGFVYEHPRAQPLLRGSDPPEKCLEHACSVLCMHSCRHSAMDSSGLLYGFLNSGHGGEIHTVVQLRRIRKTRGGDLIFFCGSRAWKQSLSVNVVQWFEGRIGNFNCGHLCQT